MESKIENKNKRESLVNNESSNERYIELCNFLKVKWGVPTGGQAKVIIRLGEVKVNGLVDTRNKKKLRLNDVVEFDGEKIVVDDSVLK